jgi:NTP pyrophosphatase (non-canonical NTP hydrolase)
MTINDLQDWVRNDWEKHSKHTPTVELQLLYIIEEFGEVAEAIRKSNGAKDRKQGAVDLGSELADLLISITTLANHFDINITKELEAFQTRIAARHKSGF